MAILQTLRISVAAADRRDDDVATRPGDAAPAPASAIVSVERQPVLQSATRHDAFFVTQLIAMAQHSPQTRVLRRAEPQVAHAAYHSTSERDQGRERIGARLLRDI